MSSSSAALDPLLTDLRRALDDLYGDRLVRLMLYGSQARGDTHEESDVDLLVVLKGPVESGHEIRRMGDIRTRLGLQHERALSLLPISETEYQERSSSWLTNARRDGKDLSLSGSSAC
jgi:predicted nucleotidyltransferase